MRTRMRTPVFVKDDEAQVLGLPMYLIIVMIVAVAVIAAVIFMIPQGTGMINAQIINNAVIAETPGHASAFTFGSYEVEVKVTSNNNPANPIAGATVTLVGSGDADSATTNSNGIATLSVSPSLSENINEGSMKLTVRASGYQEYTDDFAVTIYRLS